MDLPLIGRHRDGDDCTYGLSCSSQRTELATFNILLYYTRVMLRCRECRDGGQEIKEMLSNSLAMDLRCRIDFLATRDASLDYRYFPLDMAGAPQRALSTASSESTTHTETRLQSPRQSDQSTSDRASSPEASMPHPLRCGNCGQRHGGVGEDQFQHCLYITVRRSGRRPISLPGDSQALQDCFRLPHELRRLESIRDVIWQEFEALVEENELERALVRQDSAGSSYGKGAMKQKAPIPWLKWAAPDGRTGQTRSRENFVQLWNQIVLSNERFVAGTSMWLNCVLLQSSTSTFVDTDNREQPGKTE